MKRNAVHTRSLGIFLAAFAFGMTPTASLAEVPAKAQAAFNKGVLAAQQQEWVIALQSFQDARKIAPTAPEIYYNLGLTESKIPGRELRAIAWLAAYLAAEPAAPNASAVKTAILSLLVKNEGNNDRFLEIARQTAEQVPEGDLNYKQSALSDIFALYAEQGDEAKAASFARDAHLDQTYRRAGLIAMTQFGGRDGIERVRAITTSEPEIGAAIVTAEAKLGDIAGALRDMSLIRNGESTRGALTAVAMAQFKAGQKQASWASLQKAKMALRNATGADLNDYYSDICSSQTSVGDLAGALATAEVMKHNYERKNCLSGIGLSQLAMGDLPAALSTANQIDDSSDRSELESEMCERQVRAGNLAGAQTTAKAMAHGSSQDTCLTQIGRSQLVLGDAAGAQATVNQLSAWTYLRDVLEEYKKDPVATKAAQLANQSEAFGYFDNSHTDAGKPKRISAWDWIKELDDDYGGLNRPVFLNFFAYVTSATNTDPHVLSALRAGNINMSAMDMSANALASTAYSLLSKRRFVTEMLTKQFGPGFVP